MAFSITELANYDESSGSGQTLSKTTGTVSIPANSVILVFGHGSHSTTPWNSATMSVSDSVDGTTGWSGLDSQVNLGTNTFDGGGRAFYKSFTSGGSLTITVARNTGTVFWGYSVVAITGQEISNPIVQAKGTGTQWSDTGDSHSQSVTLSSAPTSGNAVVAFLGVNNDSDGSATTPAGYTVLNNPSAQIEATSSTYHTSTATAAINWSDCGQAIQYAIAVAVEVRLANNTTAPLAWLGV